MRRNRAQKRKVKPDLKYNSETLARFINKLMHGGKKSVATKVAYNALDIVEKRAKKPGIEVFNQAVKNITPSVEVRPRRVGGATYQIPMEVRRERKLSLALRWLLASTRKRSGKSMAHKLASELLDAANGQGTAIKKKDDTHRMAEANKAFAHYRW
ncbi:MAG: 30S ribosomal protein S7 [Anaerolineaceae bacterium 4572_78]|nr:MAG: 30S ribosomal protein S7 [Anaerolineaceae bacterium 4572_78]